MCPGADIMGVYMSLAVFTLESCLYLRDEFRTDERMDYLKIVHTNECRQPHGKTPLNQSVAAPLSYMELCPE